MPSDNEHAFSRRLWRVCFMLPMIGTLIATCITVVLVLIFSDYPFATRIQTALGFTGLIAVFGLIFTLTFPPIFRLFYLRIVRRHPRDARIALRYGFLLGMGLPLLLAAIAGVTVSTMRLFASLIWSTTDVSGWHQFVGFIVFAGLASAIPGGIVGPIAAHFGLQALRPHDPHFDVPPPARPGSQAVPVPGGV